jgi:HTH-type transcriptional regulator/antitoxin HipB
MILIGNKNLTFILFKATLIPIGINKGAEMDNNLATMKDIGDLIRSTRKQQGLSQEDLAGISGTGRRFISDVENGKNNIQVGKLLLVIKALGLSLYIFNKWMNK